MLAVILILIFAATFLIASVAVTAGSFLLGSRRAIEEGTPSFARAAAPVPAGAPEHDLGLAATTGPV